MAGRLTRLPLGSCEPLHSVGNFFTIGRAGFLGGGGPVRRNRGGISATMGTYPPVAKKMAARPLVALCLAESNRLEQPRDAICDRNLRGGKACRARGD